MVISLHFKSVGSEINIFSIPPEILANILENVYPYVNESFIRISLVSKEIESRLQKAVPYVESMSVRKIVALQLFSGVKHVKILNNWISMRKFRMDIWKNVESMVFVKDVFQLYEKDFIESEDGSRCLKYSFFMPKLRILEIRDSLTVRTNLNQDVIPNLRVLNVFNSTIHDSLKFNHLKILRIYNSAIRMDTWKNLEELSLDNVEYSFMFDFNNTLNIPSLQRLTVKDTYYPPISTVNLEELILDNSMILYPGAKNMKRVIPNELTFLQMVQFIDTSKYPALKILKIKECPGAIVSASNLVEITVDNCPGINIEEGLHKFVKSLN